MYTFRVLLTLLFVSPFLPVRAQEDEWDELLQELAEDQGDADSDETVAWAEQVEELTDLREHPLDLNKVTREELLRLPFMDAKQAQAIIDYRARNGSFHTRGELLLVPELDASQIRWLRQVVVVQAQEQGQRTTKRRADPRWRQEWLARLDVPLYRRAGWSWERGLANRLRYMAQCGPRWELGVRAENDAGEEMLTRRQKEWDAWGGYVMGKDLRIGSAWKVQTALAGDFKSSFGEGLVMNTGFRFGKMQHGLWRTSTALRPHRSTEESRFLRGAALTMAIGDHWTLTALGSWRKLDATLQKDNTVQSINTTGLHRTDGERNRKGTLGAGTAALHLQWQQDRVQVGVTGVYQYFDHLFRQGKALYRQIYPQGYQFGAVSTDYGFRVAHLTVKGETAHSFAEGGGGWATLNEVTWRKTNDWQLSAIYRFYGQRYYAPHASAFGEYANVQNESGLCVLMDVNHLGPISLRVFFDYFYSPFPRYTMSRHSSGFESAVQTTWQVSRKQKAIVRYAIKSKEQSDARYLSHRLRCTYLYTLNDRWNGYLSASLHHYRMNAKKNQSTGVAVMPRIDYSSRQRRWHTSLAGIWFSTPDYNSQIYLYEPSLSHTFGMQMLYGKGERLMALVKWQLGDRQRNGTTYQLQLKAGVTHYRDRSTISSGPTLIDSAWKTDLQLLFRCQLR